MKLRRPEHTACIKIPSRSQYPIAKEKSTGIPTLDPTKEPLHSESDYSCPERDAKRDQATPRPHPPALHQLAETSIFTPMRQLVKIPDDDSGSWRGSGLWNADWVQVAGVVLSSSKSAALSHEGRVNAAKRTLYCIGRPAAGMTCGP